MKFYRLSGATFYDCINPCPAELGYTLPLQTMYIQISWLLKLLKKPTDLDPHCLSRYVNLYQQSGSSNLFG